MIQHDKIDINYRPEIHCECHVHAIEYKFTELPENIFNDELYSCGLNDFTFNSIVCLLDLKHAISSDCSERLNQARLPA